MVVRADKGAQDNDLWWFSVDTARLNVEKAWIARGTPPAQRYTPNGLRCALREACHFFRGQAGCHSCLLSCMMELIIKKTAESVQLLGAGLRSLPQGMPLPCATKRKGRAGVRCLVVFLSGGDFLADNHTIAAKAGVAVGGMQAGCGVES
jgi:hypothetical protein